MSEVARALSAASDRIAAVSDTPRLDAELLLAHALGITRERLLIDPPQGEMPPLFDALVERRASGEPVAYLVGRKGFWTIELMVGPGVLIPRGDSETLIEAALAHFAGRAPPQTILDLGTGPGTLLLAALSEWPDAQGLGIDASPQALDYARRNAAALGLDKRAELRPGHWADGVTGRFDLILCNPPYVRSGDQTGPGVAEHEPHEALFAGADGLDDYRQILPALSGLLAEGGLAAIEIGHDQAADVLALVEGTGLSGEIARDLGKRDRALLLTLPR